MGLRYKLSRMSEDKDIERTANAIQMILRSFLVAGRAGLPAEGKIPFNPLYFNILRMIDQAGTMRASTLVKTLETPKTTISTALAALRKRGLLTQQKDPSDGRAQIVKLTKDGTDLAQSIRRQDLKNSAVLLALAGDARRDLLIEILEDIARQISAQE